MSNNYLVHHGIKGQKWGVRRYQNEDGSLTSAGEGRYNNPTSINPGPNKLPKASNGGINPGSNYKTPDVRMREHASRLKERIKERRAVQKERSIERGKKLTQNNYPVAKERGKAFVKTLGVLAVGTTLSMFADDSKTRGLINAGTGAAAAIVNNAHNTAMRDIRNYRKSQRGY